MTPNPSTFGMRRSRMMTANEVSAIRSIASRPSDATSTVSPRWRRTDASKPRIPGSSSAMRTRLVCSTTIDLLCEAQSHTRLHPRCCQPDPESAHALVKRHHRIDVHRNVLGAIERGMKIRRHLVVLAEPGLGARSVAGRLDLQHFLRHSGNGVADLRVVDRIEAVVRYDCAALGEVVELHHFRAAMRFCGSESNGPEDACDIRRVVLLEPFLRQRAV